MPSEETLSGGSSRSSSGCGQRGRAAQGRCRRAPRASPYQRLERGLFSLSETGAAASRRGDMSESHSGCVLGRDRGRRTEMGALESVGAVPVRVENRGEDLGGGTCSAEYGQ